MGGTKGDWKLRMLSLLTGYKICTLKQIPHKVFKEEFDFSKQGPLILFPFLVGKREWSFIAVCTDGCGVFFNLFILQIQAHIYESTVVNKEASLIQVSCFYFITDWKPHNYRIIQVGRDLNDTLFQPPAMDRTASTGPGSWSVLMEVFVKRQGSSIHCGTFISTLLTLQNLML